MIVDQAKAPITVTIRLYDGSRKAEADLESGVRVSEVLELAKQRWHLDGERDYRLVHAARSSDGNGLSVESDVELDEDATLAECGVRQGSVLTVCPVLVAGAGAGAGSTFAAVRRRRLTAERRALEGLLHGSAGVLRLVSESGGPPASGYVLELTCPGMVAFDGSAPRVSDGPHRFEVVYPDDYPRPGTTPRVRFLTPLLHVHVFRDGRVCLGAISGPDEPLDALVGRLSRLVQCDPDLLDLNSPANQGMVAWTRQNHLRLPLGRVRLGRAEAAAESPRSRIAWTELS